MFKNKELLKNNKCTVNTCLLTPLQPIHWTVNQQLLPKKQGAESKIPPSHNTQHGPDSCKNSRTVTASGCMQSMFRQQFSFNFQAEGCQIWSGVREPPTERISPTSWETYQNSLRVWPALAVCLVMKFERVFKLFWNPVQISLLKTVWIWFQCCQPAVLALPRHLTAITQSATHLWPGKLLFFNEDCKKQGEGQATRFQRKVFASEPSWNSKSEMETQRGGMYRGCSKRACHEYSSHFWQPN